MLDVPLLHGFGWKDLPTWPLTAVAYAALSLGYLAAIRTNFREARLLWAVPLTIATITLIESATGFDPGIDRMLFPDGISQYPVPHSGRPGTITAVILILLSIAGYATRAERRLRDEIGSLFASGALALGIATSALILLHPAGAPGLESFRTSLPSAISAIALATGFIAWNIDFSWVRLLNGGRPRTPWLRIALPLVLLLPMVPALFEFAFVPAEMRSPLASQLALVGANIVIVAMVAYGAVVRLARGQEALVELTNAIDSATIALIDGEGCITHWSRGCELLYGWSASQAIGQNKYALLQSRCEQPWSIGLPQQTGSGAQELVECRRDGLKIAVLERAQRVEAEGQPARTVLSMTDLSANVEAMQALHASEERLALAASAHELGVFEWDVSSGRIDWSPGAEQRLGLIPGSISDFEGWRAQILPEDLDAILDSVARAVADHAERFSYRYRFLNRNGTVRAVEGSSRAFYDRDGNLVRTVGVIFDVTESDEREVALREREAQLRSVLETVPDAMVAVDDRGTIAQFSAAAEMLWGYRAQDMVGRDFTMLAPLAERERYAALLDINEADDRRLNIEGTGEAADGRRFPVEIRTGLARTDGTALFTIFFRDVSERRAAEEHLTELNAELAHVSRQSAMSELAADLAHELNQPLSATANFLSAARMLVERGEESSRIAELLSLGAEQTLRAGQIIRRMRDFTARGEVEMSSEPIEQTVRDAVALVLMGTSQFDIRVAYDFDDRATTIKADRIQVQQVVVNLVRNAMNALLKVDDQEREISIRSAYAKGDMIEIEIADNGPGIDEAVVKELFTRFTTTSTSSEGMGIGLSISKRIIEAHGGELSAGNRPGGGAVFRFTLPAAFEG